MIIYTSYGSGKVYGEDIEKLYRLWTGRSMGDFTTHNEYLVVARTDTGEIVGAAMVIVMPDVVRSRRWGLVENVFVHPSYRKQRIGAELMRVIEIQAFGLGCKFIKLTSRKPEGQALYRSLGYREGIAFYRTISEQGLQDCKVATVCVAGYFDPIHEGHLDHIEKAGALGRLVVIAGTTEQCDQKHKGHHFHSWDGKVRMLLKMGAHKVVPNMDTDGTCAKTLMAIRPNIFAKGEGVRLRDLPIAEVRACAEIDCKIVVGIGSRLNESRKFWKGAVCEY